MTNDARKRLRVLALAASLARFARGHAVLVVSAAAALVTVAFVPPDEAYLGYFDLKTLACLFGILAVVGALRGIGLFEHAARLVVARFSTCRAAVAALVAATLVLSMFATNDMALIMMLPLATATLLKAGWERALPFAFIMQNLAANLGGMILPFGNPQNLYLYERFSIPLVDFLAVMAAPFAASVVLIAVCCALFVRPDAPRATEGQTAEERATENGVAEERATGGRALENGVAEERVAENSRAEERGTEEGATKKRVTENSRAEGERQRGGSVAVCDASERRTNVSRETSSAASAVPAAPAALTAASATSAAALTGIPATPATSAVRRGLSRRGRAVAYFALLALVIASVFRLVPFPVALGVVVVVLAVLDRRALRSADLGLLLTFACFFVFAGNMARIPAVEGFFSLWMGKSALLVGAGASQIISNVPAAVLLSHFTDSYPALLVGVNVGGAGTLVASLASLIAFSEYRAVYHGFPGRRDLARVTPGAYLARFTAFNVAFLIVLLLVCAPLV